MSKLLFNTYTYLDEDSVSLSMISFYTDKVLIINTYNQKIEYKMDYNDFSLNFCGHTFFDIDTEGQEQWLTL